MFEDCITQKNNVIDIVLRTNKEENKFLISLGDFDKTNIFSSRKEQRIDKMATKLRKTL